jgi:hypothetical protein
LFEPKFKLSTLLLFEWFFIKGELTPPPTRVLELMAGWPTTDPALELGRDW